MYDFIKEINENSKLLIDGFSYKVKAKSKFVTQKNPNNWYVKIFLDDHYALVISPADDFIYFGQDVGSIGIKKPFDDLIIYKNKNYHQTSQDYQIVINLEFGSPLETEGEVEFWDYECESNEHELISIGIVKRTGKRSDIVANIISLEDIKIITE